MPTLTSRIARADSPLERVLAAFAERRPPTTASDVWSQVRARHGFLPLAAPLLTPPSANHKLSRAAVPSFGLTLQHHVTRLLGLTVNACPSAGQCVKMCVLDTGHGRRPDVIRARQARTELFARHPEHALDLLGFELGRAVRKYGSILFRPNVNSDVDWRHVFDGGLPLDGVTFYGYTKRDDILTRDVDDNPFGECYSLNERSNDELVARYLERGGTVAAVTNRVKGAPVRQWHSAARVVDADETDEWMFTRGVIGDLSAKGRARSLSSRFVREVY